MTFSKTKAYQKSVLSTHTKSSFIAHHLTNYPLSITPLSKEKKELFKTLLKRIKGVQEDKFVEFKIIDLSDKITVEERKFIWDFIICERGTIELRSEIDKWLKAIDASRAVLATTNFIDDL